MSQQQKVSLEQESREMIETGDALPTPAFAVEEGGEALDILEDHITHFLSPTELFSLRANLIDVQKLINENNMDALQSKFNLLSGKRAINSLVFGFITGLPASIMNHNPLIGLGAAALTFGVKTKMDHDTDRIDLSHNRLKMRERVAALLSSIDETLNEINDGSEQST